MMKYSILRFYIMVEVNCQLCESLHAQVVPSLQRCRVLRGRPLVTPCLFIVLKRLPSYLDKSNRPVASTVKIL